MGQFAEGSVEAKVEEIDRLVDEVFKTICIDSDFDSADVYKMSNLMTRIVEKAKDIDEAVTIQMTLFAQ